MSVAAAIAPIAGSPSLALVAKSNADVPALPPGYPAQLKSEMAWAGSDFRDPSDYTLTLSDAWKAEIRAAVESYKCKYLMSPKLAV